MPHASATCKSAISSDNLTGILAGISSDILAGTCSHIRSDLLSGISSDILTGILSDISSDVLSGILIEILNGILSGIYSDIHSGNLAYLLTFYLAVSVLGSGVHCVRATCLVPARIPQLVMRLSLEEHQRTGKKCWMTIPL